MGGVDLEMTSGYANEPLLQNFAAQTLMNQFSSGKQSGSHGSGGSGGGGLGGLAGQLLGGLTGGGGHGGGQSGGHGGSSGGGGNGAAGKLVGQLASNLFSSGGGKDKPAQPQNYHGGTPQNQPHHGGLIGGVVNAFGGHSSSSVSTCEPFRFCSLCR